MRQDDVLATAIQEVLGEKADLLANEQGLKRRPGKLSGAAFARTLVLGFLRKPDATLEDLAQTAALVAQPVSPQAIDQRFTPQATAHVKACLEAAVERVIQADEAATTAILDRFTEVCVLDSTTLSLPDQFAGVFRGCGGSAPTVGRSALKFQVQFELKHGGLHGFRIEEGRAADTRTPLQTENIAAGALHLRDLGYFDLSVFQAITAQKAYYLSRLQPMTVVFDSAGTRLVMSQWLRRQRRPVIDVSVTVGSTERLPCRLIALRIPRHLRRERRKKLRRYASKQGYTPSKERVAWCDWNIYITNLPTTLLTAEEAAALIRLRWQIELLFKQWKSVGQLNHSRSQRPERLLCELFAKMLALVIQHWILISYCWRYPNRSLRRASKAVQCLAGSLAIIWRDRRQLLDLLAHIARAMQQTGRVDRRHRHPSTFQVIDNPARYGYKIYG